MKLSTILTTLAFLAIAAAAPQSAAAWGRLGHHITVHLAEREMEPEALAAVKELLGDESMADASLWADRIRNQRPETAPFHYVNGPRGVLRPTEEDFNLPQGNVWSAVLGYSEVVADETQSKEERAEALRFLIHFIGDLHQPLHCGYADDLGANREPVLFRGRELNLHRIWDTEILDPYIQLTGEEAAAIIWENYTDEERAGWVAVGDPKEWVVESREFIFAGLYPPRRIDTSDNRDIAVIDETYLRVWSPVAELQLARSGSRIAATLNALFVTGASPYDAPPIPFPPARLEAAPASAGD